MSGTPPTGAPDGAGPADDAVPAPRRRRRALAAAAAAVVAALVVLALTLGDRDAESAAAATDPVTSSPAAPTEPAGADPAAETSAPAAGTTVSTPVPTGPTEVVDELPAALPEVALDEPAEVGNGIVATLPSIEAVQGQATGPGNVNGPAVRVTVRIENGTGEAISLDGVAANLYTGADRAPASPLDDASAQAFSGVLPAGDAAEAVYVFSVPADARDAVTVEVGYQAGAPLLLFTGSVS